MNHRVLTVGIALFFGTVLFTALIAPIARASISATDTAARPYARIAIMRALDGHSVDLEAGYVRHLEWHRQAKDTFDWYSYSVWASTERQRWMDWEDGRPQGPLPLDRAYRGDGCWPLGPAP